MAFCCEDSYDTGVAWVVGRRSQAQGHRSEVKILDDQA